MKTINRAIVIVSIFLSPFFVNAQQAVSIIPQPVSMSLQQGQFMIDNNTSINFNSKQKDLASASKFLNSFIKTISGNELPVNAKKNKSIVFEIKKTDKIGDEGYLLNVSPTRVSITANTKAGIVYGLQSLMQVLPQIRTNAALIVPCLNITDYPRFKYRGMHLDVCRHFFSADMV
ncbi:MAG: beta-N-acetylhexosaminidase, partial [Ginsengibacter sp.]